MIIGLILSNLVCAQRKIAPQRFKTLESFQEKQTCYVLKKFHREILREIQNSPSISLRGNHLKSNDTAHSAMLASLEMLAKLESARDAVFFFSLEARIEEIMPLRSCGQASCDIISFSLIEASILGATRVASRRAQSVSHRGLLTPHFVAITENYPFVVRLVNKLPSWAKYLLPT